MGRTPSETAAKIARDRILREKEKIWEAEMTIRIAEMTAIIREENDERKRLLGGPSIGHAIPAAHLWRGQLPTGIDFQR